MNSMCFVSMVSSCGRDRLLFEAKKSSVSLKKDNPLIFLILTSITFCSFLVETRRRNKTHSCCFGADLNTVPSQAWPPCHHQVPLWLWVLQVNSNEATTRRPQHTPCLPVSKHFSGASPLSPRKSGLASHPSKTSQVRFEGGKHFSP